MRIIYIGAFRLPCYDAAAARVLNNARALKMSGHEISFISWGGSYREMDLCSDGKYRIDGMEYIITNELEVEGSIFQKFFLLINRGQKTLSTLNAMTSQPDVIILYNANYGWTNTMLRFCYNNNIILVNDITEWFDPNELYFFQRRANDRNMEKLQHKVKNKIVISSYLNSYYNDSNNLLVPPLCNPNDSKWGLEIEDKRVPNYDGVTLIYAGTPAKKDNLLSAIRVVNRLAIEGKSIRMIILGCERDVFISNNQNCFESSELHQNIIFLGRVLQDKVPAYYKKADFMVLLREPTRKNMAGFPTKVAEAITAGVPVITNNTSDLPRYVHDGQNGFLLGHYDDKSLYDLLLYKVLPLSVEERIRMKKNATDSSKSFNYESYIKEFDSFIKNLI